MQEDFEKSLKDAIAFARARYGENNVASFSLDIEVRGRTLDGDLEVTFVFAESYSAESNKSARGGGFHATLEEFLHRFGWAKRNAPLRLGHRAAAAAAAADEPADD